MKKSVKLKKLELKLITIRILADDEISKAVGGTDDNCGGSSIGAESGCVNCSPK